MNDRNGHICPECGAPWGSEGSPTCDCARRAADALLETRSAETAAAEDFDPLRIRPYVDLDPATPGSTPPTDAVPATDGTDKGHTQGYEHEYGYAHGAPSEPPPTSAPHETHAPHEAHEAHEAHEREPADAAATAQLPRATALPRSTAPGTSLFEEAHQLAPAAEPASESTGRRRRFALVGAGATAAVVAAAGFASGLFSYDTPSRESAAPDDIRASVPDATLDEPSPSVSESPSPSPSSSPTESSSASATPSPTRSTASAAPPRPTATTRAPSSTAAPTPTTTQPSTPPEKVEPVTLRRGDEGPEVTELQQRLQQVALFTGNPDGDYDNKTENAVRNYQLTRGIDNEDTGTYDKETRTRLESETTEP
ncbi:peptidoglycan-binding protein [Streptomyces sp. NPDC050988]|uniref:peptidoglycan-binding protein n=1 Tax=Streptomyces sp. NPDC050988 TaxID=3365637 RepID=UPI0037897418